MYKFKKPNKPIVYNEKQLYNYGINRLSVREYSRAELEKKMLNYGTPELVKNALDKLVSQNYLSDIRRAKSIYNQYKEKESVSKVKRRMSDKGITKDTMEEFFEELNEEKELSNIEIPTEIDNATQLLLKKYKRIDSDLDFDAKNKLKQSMIRFLASRGYNFGDISKAIQAFNMEIDEYSE
jgi:SOS response regulatory protein OraA/RecX